MRLFSLPALGLVLTSKQTLYKTLMNGDRLLVEWSKGGRRPATTATDKLWDLEEAPDPLWASVSPFLNEGGWTGSSLRILPTLTALKWE